MKYRISVQGENFLLSGVGTKPQKYGFYVTAHVEAASPEEAEASALLHLRDYEDLRKMVRNDASDRPKLRIDEIETIADWPAGVTRPLNGLSLYEE